MAYELLRDGSLTHLYRHDLESLFYVMLLLCARHTFTQETNEKTKKTKTTRRLVMRPVKFPGTLPYAKWFDARDYEVLGNSKNTFFTELDRIKLSPVFEDFCPWLRPIQHQFGEGFASKSSHKRLQDKFKRKIISDDPPRSTTKP
jgi:hypothetical protein